MDNYPPGFDESLLDENPFNCPVIALGQECGMDDLCDHAYDC